MMKKTKIYLGLAIAAIAGVILVAADHIDAPSTTATSADIADFYAFEPTTGSNNTVFIVDLQSNVLPNLAYGTFDENVLTEINIDTNGDLVEDMVIQAIPRDGFMYFFGPVTPVQKGLDSQVLVNAPLGNVEISKTTAKVTTTPGGVKLFAGPRQDAFFFDFFQFNAVIAGNAPNGFKAPKDAVDTFDGSNTMSIAIELPNSLLGPTTAKNALGVEVYKTWVTSNIKK